ncbi:MAG: AgmX/PglI C-terminal domain-containing protein [Myxococcales bacterium]|nr:AgmX/PglI C-terminal domain-containing protein [Myxococcales bacterium]
MSMRLGSFILLCVVAGVAAAVSACDPAPEPPPQVPKNAPRPPDKTEVTMEVSSDPPPGEAARAAAAASEGSLAPSAPEPSEDVVSGGVQSDPVVEKAMAPVRSRLNACYKKALAAEAGIGGNATFDATIGKDGRVASARFVKRDGLNEDMVGCLLATVKAMTFDTSNTNKKSQIVTLAFGSAPAAADGGFAPPADAGAKR